MKQGRVALFAGAFILGLLGGFRQTVILFALPLWLFCVFCQTRDWRKLIVAGGLLGLGVLVWYVPVIANVGGLSNYSQISNGLSGDAAQRMNMYFGGIAGYLYMNFANLLVWSLQMLTPIGWVCLPWSFVLIRKRWRQGLWKNRTVLYFALWTLPPLLFYALIFIDKPGYLLNIVPPLCIITARAVEVVVAKTSPVSSRNRTIGLLVRC